MEPCDELVARPSSGITYIYARRDTVNAGLRRALSRYGDAGASRKGRNARWETCRSDGCCCAGVDVHVLPSLIVRRRLRHPPNDAAPMLFQCRWPCFRGDQRLCVGARASCGAPPSSTASRAPGERCPWGRAENWMLFDVASRASPRPGRLIGVPGPCAASRGPSDDQLPDAEQHFHRQLIELLVAEALRAMAARSNCAREQCVAVRGRVLRDGGSPAEISCTSA